MTQRPRPAAIGLLAAVLAACSGGEGDIIFEHDDPWAWTPSYPGVGTGRVVISNAGDDTVSLLDLETLDPFWTTPVGRVPAEPEAPHHCAVDPAGEFFYIGISYFTGSGSGPHGSHGIGENDGYALKYDAETNLLAGSLRVDRNPGDIRLTNDGTRILVTHFDLLRIQEVLEMGGTEDEMRSTLRIIDAETMELIREVPACPAIHGVLPSADDSVAYLACWGSDELAIVPLDEEDPTVTRVTVGPAPGGIGTPVYGPYALAIHPTDGTVWVSMIENGDIRVYDPGTGAFDESRTIATGAIPFFGDFSADGSEMIMPLQGSNRLAFIDTETGMIEQQIDLPIDSCFAPHAVKRMPGDTHAIVVCEGDHTEPGSVAVVLLGARAVEKTFDVGVYPDDVCILGGGS